MMKKLSIIILVFLFVISLASAKTEYANIGGADGDFNSGEGFFNANAQTPILRGVGVTSDTQVPLVADLDGDGTTEVIIIDGDFIRLFNSTIGFKAILSLGLTGSKSNMITFDIDGDGRREMIVAGQESELIISVDWNGTDLTIQSSLNYSNQNYRRTFLSGLAGEVQLGCDAIQHCQLHLTSSQDRGAGQRGNITVVVFNESDILNVNFIRQNPISSDIYCSPHIKNVEVVDMDNDGNLDYISSWIETDVTDTRAITVAVELNGSLKSGFPIVDDDLRNIGATEDCETGEGRFFSPPTVFRALGGIESESQILHAIQLSSDNFIIKAYSALGVFIDRFPQFATGDSILISNVIRGNFFPDTPDEDFCAVGYDSIDKQLDVICASLTSQDVISFSRTQRYEINVTDKFVIEQAVPDLWDVISHSTNHENTDSQCIDTTCVASDLDEILTPYGIYRLVRVRGFFCDFLGICELKEVFANPFNTSGVFVSVDVTGSGSEDLLLLTDTNLILLDALFLDQPPEIDRESIRVNPCVEEDGIPTTWKINTSLLLSFVVDDTDPVPEANLDQVFGQAILYADSPNEQISEVQGAFTSGSIFTFDESTFNVNKTVSNGILRLIANDTGSIEQDIIDIPFRVNEAGLEFGDCQTVGFRVVEEVVIITDATLTEDSTDNSITTGIETFAGLTGLGGTTLWLLFMIALTAGIWFRATAIGVSGASAMGTIAIFNILMIMLGARLGILSTALVVIITVIAVVIIGVFLGKFLTGSRTET